MNEIVSFVILFILASLALEWDVWVRAFVLVRQAFRWCGRKLR